MPDALIIAGAAAAYGILHSLLASTGVKRRFRDRLGARAHRFYRLGYNLLAAATFVPILALLARQPGLLIYRLNPPWSGIAMAGQLLSLCLLGIGLLQTDAWSFLGLRQTVGPPAESSPLLTTGLYRWVRHPLYTAGLLFIWLTPVMTTSLVALYLTLTLYVLMGSRLEERRLVAEFGEAYRDYQRRVPSLLPCRLPFPR